MMLVVLEVEEEVVCGSIFGFKGTTEVFVMWRAVEFVSRCWWGFCCDGSRGGYTFETSSETAVTNVFGGRFASCID